MKKITIFYSVQNGGDGSAYPTWMESEELAEWDQDHMDEGWGESCTGSISFESESDIIPIDINIKTKEGFFLNMVSDEWSQWGKADVDNFWETFFPTGFPDIEAKIYDDKYFGLYLDDKLISKKWAGSTSQKGLERFGKMLAESLVDYSIKVDYAVVGNDI